jgi:hypothetical protein
MDKKKKDPPMVMPSRKVTDISSPSKSPTKKGTPTPPIVTEPTDDEDDMIQKRLDALEETIRHRDERIKKLQENAENQMDEMLAKLKRVNDGQKDLKWENEAMSDLLSEKE